MRLRERTIGTRRGIEGKTTIRLEFARTTNKPMPFGVWFDPATRELARAPHELHFDLLMLPYIDGDYTPLALDLAVALRFPLSRHRCRCASAMRFRAAALINCSLRLPPLGFGRCGFVELSISLTCSIFCSIL